MIKILSFLVVFLVSGNQQANGQELLQALQKKFSNTKTITASFKQTSGGKTILSGKFQYKHKNKIRLESSNLTIVSDGTDNWSYNKKDNKVIITEAGSEEASVLSLDNLINYYPSRCNITEKNNESVRSILLTPKSRGLGFNSAVIYLNSENLITKVLIDEPAGGISEIEFSDYKLDLNIPDSHFTFNPPEGCVVVDIR